MSQERFQRLYELKDTLYAKDAPLLICAGALLFDMKTQKKLAHFKCKLIKGKAPLSVTLAIRLYDEAGAFLEEIRHTYEDFAPDGNGYFGAQSPIAVPASTGALAVYVSSLDRADGTALYYTAEEWAPLPARRTVDSLSADEAALCRRAYKRALFLPERYDALYLCACGEIYLNKKASCPICKAGFLGMEALLADEAKRAKQYAEASTLYNAGFVGAEKAFTIFLALGDYKDAADLAEDCRARLASAEAQYAEAKTLCAEGFVGAEKAMASFEALDDYKDAADLAEDCRARLASAEAQYAEAKTLCAEGFVGAEK
ncbi:MAG: hypothetical protein IJY71_00030, partial [Clostridia bacterium]|nr:hypothetical protein [Clostridia bacterium]